MNDRKLSNQETDKVGKEEGGFGKKSDQELDRSRERDSRKWTVNIGLIDQMDRTFDINFWQNQTPKERFDAAWELAVNYHLNIKKDDPDKLRLQRSYIVLKPFPS